MNNKDKNNPIILTLKNVNYIFQNNQFFQKNSMHFNFQALYLNQMTLKNDKNIITIQYIYKGAYNIIIKV